MEAIQQCCGPVIVCMPQGLTSLDELPLVERLPEKVMTRESPDICLVQTDIGHAQSCTVDRVQIKVPAMRSCGYGSVATKRL